MPDLSMFLVFLGAGLLLNVTPGADMLYVITQASRHGFRAGAVAAGGVFTGTLAHIGFAVVGLSALLAASATAFALVKWMGVAYLLYMGLRLMLAQPATGTPGALSGPNRSLTAIWRGGALVNLLNPKIALFFVAFLPQFVALDAPHHTTALLLLGLSFDVTGLLINTLVAALVVGLARRPAVRRIGTGLQRVAGLVFVGLSARLALEHAP